MLPAEADDADSRPRVVIADDEILVREGLTMLLERAGFDVVGVAGDVEELSGVLDSVGCDLVILDIRMPPSFTTEGLHAAAELQSTRPEVAVLVLSSHLEVAHAIGLLGSEARTGYLLKHRLGSIEELTSSLRRLLAGESVIDPLLVRELVAVRRRQDPLGALTVREREALALMAEGRSNAGIADGLGITEKSAEKYVHRILSKLAVSDADGGGHRRVLAVLQYLDAGPALPVVTATD